MTIGKREQIVAISIGAALVIFLIHLLIFDPRTREYAQAKKEFDDGVAALKDTEVIQARKQVDDFKGKTAQYNDELSSVVAQLNIDVPRYYMSRRSEAEEQRLQEALGHIKKLVELRARLKQPELTFLNDKKDPRDPYQMQQGWHIPAQISERELGAQGALWDTVVKLSDRWVLMNAISDARQRLFQRVTYNDFLRRLGINAAEVSNWVVAMPGVGYIFFNDSKLIPQLMPALVPTPNPMSTNRFGVMVPELKKLWVSDLIWEKRDPNTQLTKQKIRDVLDVNITMDHSILATNKQLIALIDIIEMAERNSILEISKVNLMKFVGIEPVAVRVPGQTPAPTPSPTPAAAMAVGGFSDPAMEFGGGGGFTGMPGMQAAVATPDPSKKIGGGAGIEVWFRANNPNMVKFLFDITHGPRTYSLDDLDIQSLPNGQLETSMTVELVTNLDTMNK